uniref:flagellar M-ring protein FliF C-terminal domain-containing protein n=1 Tax=Agathobacter sp. TaxID=2021311 RepID=UPI004055EBFA
MPEQVKNVLGRIAEWWKKFNNRQRIVLLSAVGVVIIALAILCWVMATPTMKPLYTCSDYTEAAKIKEILDADGTIKYETTSDGLTFSVPEEDEGAASMLLGQNEIPSKAYSIDNVISGSFTTTESDTQKKYEYYLEQKFADHISLLNNVEACAIDITMPEDDGTIIARDESSTAAVMIDIAPGKTMDSDQAYGLALFIATQLGNDSTEGITILDRDNNVIYSGADAESAMGMVSSQLSYTQKMENSIKSEIKEVLIKSKTFANVEVAMNLHINFNQSTVTERELAIPEGMDSGALVQQSTYDSESTGGYDGTPGTDTNDDTTYVIEDGEYSYSVISESDSAWEYNEKITEILQTGGSINYDTSSISVVANSYRTYDEAAMQAAGELDDMTFEEFMAANSEPQLVEVDEQYIQLIANATGFSADKITILCNEVPQFVPIVEPERSITDYAQIIITVLILALLGFVVFRSTRSQKAAEQIQPELSVEALLESTVEATDPLEDIGYNDKSETRILIEKFVDENPDAVALLLRNWLNEEWE